MNKENFKILPRKFSFFVFVSLFIISFSIFTNTQSVRAEDISSQIDSAVTTDTSVVAPIEEVVTPAAEEPADVTSTEELTAPIIEEAPVESTPIVTEVAPVATPVLSTDKDDYAPGETVTLFGRFFKSLQNIAIRIFGNSEVGNHYSDVSINTTTDENGSFSLSTLLDNFYRPLYNVVASTIDGTELAAMSFTDASGVAFDLKQCAQNDSQGNTPLGLGFCNWIGSSLGSGNSKLYEGIATEQQLIMTNLPSGQHSLTVGIQSTKGGKHAYDFLVSDADATTPNTDKPGDSTKNSEQASLLDGITLQLNRCGNQLGTQAKADCNALVNGATSSNTVDIPVSDDSYVSQHGNTQDRITAYEALFGNRTVRLYTDGPITVAPIMTVAHMDGKLSGNPLAAGADTGDSYVWYTITWTGTGSNAMLVAGADIALGDNSARGWGLGNGATNISGDPYHFYLIELDGKGGSLDNQMSGSAVFTPPGSITIIKDAVPNDAQDFGFTTTGTGLSPFSLDDDSDNTLSNTRTFSSLASGTYTVQEAVAGGTWSLTNLVCVDPTSNTTTSIDTRTATINLAAGENITCTFTNTKPQHIPIPPTVTTNIHNASEQTVTSVPLGSIVHDSAAVATTNGNIIPTGTVTFDWFLNNACTGTANSNSGPLALSGGSVDATGFAKGPLAAGSYSFLAHYSGDLDYLPGDGPCEPLTVNKAQLSVSTTIHDATHSVIANNAHVALGTVVHDNATVSGAVVGFPVPTTSFTFDASAIANGSTDAGFDATTVSTSALGAGNHTFNASVGSNTNYDGATSAAEPFIVDKAQLAVTTTIHDAQNAVVANGSHVALGSMMHDNADVTGAVNGFAIPTISFTLNAGAIANAVPEATFEATSANSSALAAGSYIYQATVADNANYIGTTSSEEPFVVDKAQLGISTDIHNAAHTIVTSVPLGSIVHDTATVTGQVGSIAPTGEVTFTFGNSCPGSVIVTDANLDSGKARSVDTSALSAGSYNFQGSVAGDDNYIGATSSCEPLTVNKAQLEVTTQIHNASHVDVTGGNVPLGSVLHDTATVTGDVSGFPIPSISFTLNAVGVTNGSEVGYDAATIGSDPLAAGAYTYVATVSGDDNYFGDIGSDENVTVDRAQLSISTNVHNALDIDKTGSMVPLNSVMHDTATVTGGVSGFTVPTSIFTLTSAYSGTCTAGAAVANNGTEGSADKSAYSLALGAGAYAYRGSVVGDANYLGATGVCEPFTVINPHTTISVTSNTQETTPGENVILTITDTNDGDVALTNPSVVLTYSNPVTTVTLDKTHYYVSGDTDNDGIMDVGEAWVWSYTTLISSDTTFNVAGHGTDPLGNDITPANGYTTEGGNITVKVVNTTRTLGFWQTHTDFTKKVFGLTPLNIGSGSHKGPVETAARVFGGFYAPIAKTTSGAKRTPGDQARITLLQQLLAAKLNCAGFECSSTIQSQINAADSAYASGDKGAIMSFVSILDTYNNSGDTGAIPATLGATGSATPKASQAIAETAFWNLP